MRKRSKRKLVSGGLLGHLPPSRKGGGLLQCPSRPRRPLLLAYGELFQALSGASSQGGIANVWVTDHDLKVVVHRNRPGGLLDDDTAEDTFEIMDPDSPKRQRARERARKRVLHPK